jgi:hypothetical protein
MFLCIYELNDEPLPRKFKTAFLLKHINRSILLDRPPLYWQENIVCIIKNMHFDKAQYISNQFELDLLKQDNNLNKEWMLVPGAKQYAQ